MKRTIRLTESELINVISRIINEDIKDDLLSTIKLHHDDVYNKNKSTIDNYHYIKDKIREYEIRENPHFTLSVIKNRDSHPSIVAKVKWNLPYKDKGFRNWISVHIGSLKEFPLGLDTPNMDEIAKKRIKNYLHKHDPFKYDGLDIR